MNLNNSREMNFELKFFFFTTYRVRDLNQKSFGPYKLSCMSVELCSCLSIKLYVQEKQKFDLRCYAKQKEE